MRSRQSRDAIEKLLGFLNDLVGNLQFCCLRGLEGHDLRELLDKRGFAAIKKWLSALAPATARGYGDNRGVLGLRTIDTFGDGDDCEHRILELVNFDD